MYFEEGSKIKIRYIPAGTSIVGIVTKIEGNIVYYRTNIKGSIKELSTILNTDIKVERLISVCDRCIKEANPLRMSRFNEEMLCKCCLIEEEKHPKYKTAFDKELYEVQHGNYNYKGIGLPEDLKK